MKTLILGGVRSGKSRLAEVLALQSGLPVTFIATALPGDEEMRERIEAHRQRRPAGWQVVEEPYALAGALRTYAAAGRCVIVDCLTLWLAQLLCAGRERLARERDALIEVLPPLGQIERLAIRLAALQGTSEPGVDRVHITVFAADHGVAAEQVSAFPQSALSARAYAPDHARRPDPHLPLPWAGETARAPSGNRRHARRAVSALRPS